jgi:hypothetical protein
MVPTLPIQITCPKCGAKYAAQVFSIIDVQMEPRLKSLLLRGGLNTVTCPSCGAPGRVSAPLLYHDPQKEFLLFFIPPELNLPMAEREKLTGSMLSALMSAVPAGERKGYFLNPRTVLTMQGLIDEILQADGITKEMMEEQRLRGQLVQDLLRALDDETALNALVEQNKQRIDYQFFLTLAASAEGSAGAGQTELAEKLLKLRDALLARLPTSLPEPLPDDTPPSVLVDRILAAKDKDARWAYVLYNRPLLNYAFFEELTGRIAKATPEEAEALRALRTNLLEMTEQLDKEALAVQDAKLKFLQELLASSDPLPLVRQRKEEIDSFFLSIVGGALRDAQHKGKTEEAQKLQAINAAILKLLQESLPPEVRFVNDLLAQEYPQGTEKMLRERQGEWDANFLEILEALAQDLEEQKRPETAQRLREIRAQAQTIVPTSASAAGPTGRPSTSEKILTP